MSARSRAASAFRARMAARRRRPIARCSPPSACASSASRWRWWSPKPVPRHCRPRRRSSSTTSELPVVTDPVAAMQPGAPAVWDEVPDNIGFLWKRGDAARTELALRDAAHVTRLQFFVSRVTANSMEPRGAWAEVGAGRAAGAARLDPVPVSAAQWPGAEQFPAGADGDPRAAGRCRRLVRDEVRRAAGIRAGLLGGAPAGPAGALDCRSHRGPADRRAGARDAHHRRARPGCGGQNHRVAAALGRQPGRLRLRPVRLAGRQYRRHRRGLRHPDDLRGDPAAS